MSVELQNESMTVSTEPDDVVVGWSPKPELTDLRTKPSAFRDDIVSSRQAADYQTNRTSRQKIRSASIVMADTASLLLSVFTGFLAGVAVRALMMNDPDPAQQADSWVEPILVFLFMAALFYWKSWSLGHYTRFRPVWTELREILRLAVHLGAAGAVLLFALKLNFSRLWLGFFLVSLFVFVPVVRAVVRRQMIRADVWFKPTYIVGTGDNAVMAASAFDSDVSMGHEVKGFLDLFSSGTSSTLAGKPIFSRMPEAVTSGREESPCLVFAFDSLEEMKRCRTTLNHYIASSSYITIAPPINGLPLCGAEIVNVFRHDALLLKLQNNINRPMARFSKRVCDIVVAGLALIALSPIMLLLYGIVGRDGGSPIYAHRRIGRGGKEFYCLKFRSMAANSDDLLARCLEQNPEAALEWAETQKLTHDPRVTRIGSFLRKSSLDELPQLINVLRGEMSIVGPRPIVSAEKCRYGEYLPYYLAMVPGITGLWQSSGRSDTTYAERVLMDVWYSRNWSLWHDLVIVLRTIPSLLNSYGAR